MVKFLQINKSDDANIDGVNMYKQNKIATRYAFLSERLIIMAVRNKRKSLPHFVMVGNVRKTWFKLGKV